MAEGIFRKKSMDRVASPEQLNDYIRVANPGVWMLLGGIIVLFLGVCIWGIFGHLDTNYTTGAVCTGGTLVCYVNEAYAGQISSGMGVTVENQEFTVDTVSNQAKAASRLSTNLRNMGSFTEDQLVYEVSCVCDLPDGEYQAVILLESVAPISFVTN